jgi:hypothetical protein
MTTSTSTSTTPGPELCGTCGGGGWADLATPCPTCKGTGYAPVAPPSATDLAPTRATVPPRVPARRRGLFALQVSDRERAAFGKAAASVGKGVTVWARLVLLNAAARRVNPPDPLPTPPVEVVTRQQGRPALAAEDRRDRQLRIGMTPDERRKIDTAAKATKRCTSRWARAVLYALVAPGGSLV